MLTRSMACWHSIQKRLLQSKDYLKKVKLLKKRVDWNGQWALADEFAIRRVDIVGLYKKLHLRMCEIKCLIYAD